MKLWQNSIQTKARDDADSVDGDFQVLVEHKRGDAVLQIRRLMLHAPHGGQA